MKSLSRYCIFFILLAGCVEPFHLNVDAQYGQLVVVGRITNQIGPHSVTLAKTTYNSLVKDMPLSKAVIELFEEGVMIETLTEDPKRPGRYITGEETKGAVNKSYHLVITLKDGKVYDTKPDKMPEVLAVKSLYAKFDNQENQANIFVESDSDFRPVHCARWEWSGTYQLSLYEHGIQVDRCWVTEASQNPSLAAGTQLRFPEVIGTISNSGGRLKEKYHIALKQLSLTPAAYKYWQEVDQQKDASADFFLPTLGEIVGNAVSLDNPQEQVLGYFYAASITEKSHFIPPGILPLGAFGGNGNCLSESSTKVRPPYWE